jgi:hypothetical protein
MKKMSRTDSIAAGDLFVVYRTNAGDYRACPVTDVLSFFNENLTFPPPPGAFVTQYSAPSSTGFSVTITDGDADNSNIHLILTPTAGFSAGTIILPPLASCVDKQEILVNCTQQITSLTVDGNGATVTGEPGAIGADDFFRLKFDDTTNVWYRVG